MTYVVEGRIDHYDNQGHEGTILPGDVQWMTAGRGLIHNEIPAEGGTYELRRSQARRQCKRREVEPQNLAAFRHPIPADLWAELKRGLIARGRADAGLSLRLAGRPSPVRGGSG